MASSKSDAKMLRIAKHWGLAICALALIAIGGVLLGKYRHTNNSNGAPPRLYEGKPGPWGLLEYTRITIDPPEDYLILDASGECKPANWVFPNCSRLQVEQLLESAELDPSQRKQFLEKTEWEEHPNVTIVHPDRDLILGLSQKSRQTIYSILSQYTENPCQLQRFVFRPDWLDERFEKSGLSQDAYAGFKKLLYPQGSFLAFADATPFMSTLANPQERIRFFQVVSRRLTLLAKLNIAPGSDLNELDNYWSYEGQRKERLPLFESLARVPGGCKIDIVHLLPPFARKRIYSFPRPSDDPLDINRNCHWTAFNFFNDPPDDRFCDPKFIQQTARSDYERIDAPQRMGDIIVLTDSAGDSIHSCVYIADDLVFTKNGGVSCQPWVYMHIRDMISSYSDSERPGMIQVLRRKANK